MPSLPSGCRWDHAPTPAAGRTWRRRGPQAGAPPSFSGRDTGAISSIWPRFRPSPASRGDSARHTSHLGFNRGRRRAGRRRAGRQDPWRWRHTNHPCPPPSRLRSSPAGKETPAAACSRRTERAAAAQPGTAISKHGWKCLVQPPCLAPGANVGFGGCLRIRDLVVNHFPHPRPFHSCPWD